LNGSFLFGKLAIFTNIGEWSEIPKGRKHVFQTYKITIPFDINKNSIQLFQDSIVILSISPSESNTREFEIF
jgi:hypothetical protein